MDQQGMIEVVKINPVDDQTEEVFFYCEDPYINNAEYAPKGKYKLGPLVEKKPSKKAEE